MPKSRLGTALERFNARFLTDRAEYMKRPAWMRWIRMLPKDELDAAHGRYGGLDKDTDRVGGNGHDDKD